MIRIHLFNGSKILDVWDGTSPHFIDDWKPESRDLVVDALQVTYATTLTTFDSWGNEAVYMFIDNAYLLVDGIYYGDFTIQAV